jgi:2-dehydro-3-deoxy-D-gluconate 5-dehydrogenase
VSAQPPSADIAATFGTFLAGEVALITGASRGIGQAVAVALAELGADVALLQRSGAERTAAAVESLGRRAHVVACDLGDATAAARAVDDAVAELGRLDVCISNAAVNVRGPAVDIDLDDFRRVLDVNVLGAFAVSRAAARHFLEQPTGGRIVHLASAYCYFGGIDVLPYAASKSAVTGLVRSQAVEWARRGVRVNAVAPGWVETDFTAALRAQPERHRDITGRILLGRWADPREIAAAIAFLVSPAARYIHGQTLVVDGGYGVR